FPYTTLFRSLANEVVAATAEKQIDAASDIRFKKCRACGLGLFAGVFAETTVRKRRLHLHAPVPPLHVLPVVLKRRDVFRLQEAGDLAGAADYAPINTHRAPGAGAIPIAKRDGVFMANGFVVWRDDDQRVVGLFRYWTAGPQDKR